MFLMTTSNNSHAAGCDPLRLHWDRLLRCSSGGVQAATRTAEVKHSPSTVECHGATFALGYSEMGSREGARGPCETLKFHRQEENCGFGENCCCRKEGQGKANT